MRTVLWKEAMATLTVHTIRALIYPILLLALVLPRTVSAQAIIEAVRRNDINAVRQQIAANAGSVAAVQSDGATALHWAALQGSMEILRLLIRSGAPLEAAQSNGFTPIFAATMGNQAGALEALARAGADPNRRSSNGNAPISWAAREGKPDSLVELLLVGVDVNSPNADGNTALAVAAWYGQTDMGRLLIALGADITIKNKFGKTALDEAIRSGKSEFIKMIREYQELLDERAARDALRQISGLRLRTGYAVWSDSNATTKMVFQDDFRTSTPRPQWSVAAPRQESGQLRISTTPKGGRRFLGDFGNQNVVLTLTDLPPHKEISITFDLFVIRSWDGNESRSNAGPDIFNLGLVDGPILLQTTYWNGPPNSNRDSRNQSYPDEYPGGHFAAYTRAIEQDSLGYLYPYLGRDIPLDSVYRLQYTFAHSVPTILFRLTGKNLQSLDDESWGIANVRVAVAAAPTTTATTPTARPAPRTTAKTTAARVMPAPRRATRAVIRPVGRKPKPSAKAPSRAPVKRLHDKKQPPKP